MIVGRADETQSPAGCQRPRAAARSGVLFPFRQTFHQTERRLPRNIAGVGVHCNQPRPGWLLTRPASHGVAASVLHRRAESMIRAGAIDAGAIVGLIGAFGSAAIVATG